MAKKAESVNMAERFTEFKELKNIDKTTMISVLEESFRNVLAKMFGSDDNFDVIMNPDKGDCEIIVVDIWYISRRHSRRCAPLSQSPGAWLPPALLSHRSL